MGALYLEHPLGRKLTVGGSRGKKLACATLKQFTRCLLDFRASVSFPFFFFFLTSLLKTFLFFLQERVELIQL